MYQSNSVHSYSGLLDGQSAQAQPAALQFSASQHSVQLPDKPHSSKKSACKLSNKKLILSTVSKAKTVTEGSHARKAAPIVDAKFREQVLRLALFGWHRANGEVPISDCSLLRTSGLIADFISEASTTLQGTDSVGSSTGSTLAELTHSVQSETASCADSASLAGDISCFGFLGSVPTWELPDVVNDCGKQCRIGVDLGGVIFVDQVRRWVPQAVDGVRGLVKIFGAQNVFIVSKVKLHGPVHLACCEALAKSGGFLEKVGIPLENVVFVPAVSGPHGKGSVGEKLGLTHFVDDRYDVLQSIYADESSNSGHLVRKFNGMLFHFEHGGRCTRRPSAPAGMPASLIKHYHAVSGWPELIAALDAGTTTSPQKEPLATVFIAGRIEVHRISVGCEANAACRVVPRLLRGFCEIEDFTGVKILLRGAGSPHPQPKREEQDPLSIVIRTQANCGGALELAVPLVEDLLCEALNPAA